MSVRLIALTDRSHKIIISHFFTMINLTRRITVLCLLYLFIININSVQAKERGLKSDSCLIKLEYRDGKYVFLIHDSIIDREFLVFSRIVSSEGDVPKENLRSSGNKGSKLVQNVLKFGDIKGDSIHLNLVAYGEIIFSKSSRSINNTSQGEREVFLKYSKSGKHYEIDISRLVIENNPLIYISNEINKRLGSIKSESDLKVLSISNDGSLVEIMSSIILNKKGSIKVNTSLVLLSKEPMLNREKLFPINYYLQQIIDTSTVNKEKPKTAIIRWRVEPKATDFDKFKRGELVEPEKQIVYVVDPATPKELVPYIRKGVEAWNVAFERIGFKNVLLVKEVGRNGVDSSNMYSGAHSMIYYVKSEIRDASYSTVVDPRSGEILQSPVIWSSGCEQWLRESYFASTAAIDSRVQADHFDKDVMGELVQRLISHEIGHCLGFFHNMIASNSVNSKRLRDKKYLQKYGCTPSIMDYSRYNYVGQPNDKLDSDKALMWNIGDYDYWAIKVGYSYFPPEMKNNKISDLLLKWNQKHSFELKYRCSNEDDIDPRNVVESLGNNPIYSSQMGIRNIKSINIQALEWINPNNIENRNTLISYYNGLVNQYFHLIDHVAENIFGSYDLDSSRSKFRTKLIPQRIQRGGVKFMDSYCFRYPDWLFKKGLGAYLSISMDSTMDYLQNLTVYHILSVTKLERSLLARNGERIVVRLWKSLRKSIWSEIYSEKGISKERIKLQDIYLEALRDIKNQLNLSKQKKSRLSFIVNGELNELNNDLKLVNEKSSMNEATKKHIRDCKMKIAEIIRST